MAFNILVENRDHKRPFQVNDMVELTAAISGAWPEVVLDQTHRLTVYNTAFSEYVDFTGVLGDLLKIRLTKIGMCKL